jgi:hypothetical protein
LILDFINDPVIADPDAVSVFQSVQRLTNRRAGIGGQTVKGEPDSLLQAFVPQFLQKLARVLR